MVLLKIEDVASKKHEHEIFSTLKINEFHRWFYAFASSCLHWQYEKSRMWQARNINSKSFQHWRSLSSIANSTLSLAPVSIDKMRNRGCGKQETWTRNPFNTEDQWVPLLIVCFRLLLSPLTKWEIKDMEQETWTRNPFNIEDQWVSLRILRFLLLLSPVTIWKIEDVTSKKHEL